MSVSQNQLASRMLRLRMPKVCVPLAASEPGDLFYKADLQVRENTFLEFRLDFLNNPLTAIPGLKRFFEYRPDAIAIATCRRAQWGGKFKGSLNTQAEVLIKAAAAGCQIIDLEMESAEAMRAAELERVRSSAVLMLSHHNFRATGNLEAVFLRLAAFAPDFYKIVTTAHSLHDNVLMLNFLQKHGDDHSLVGICMGEQGVISRVLGVRAGGAFTFGSAGQGEQTASGQPTVRELQEVYRIDQLDATTRVYGVAANPVRHSLSPLLMNAAMRRENVNGVYLPLLVKSLQDLLACVREIPIHGLSVTMPYKEQITASLDKSDQLTAATGSCNTVVRSQDGQLVGYNTDIAGILTPLEAQMPLSGAKVLVIGAGGAARAAVYGLKQKGADVYIVDRTPANTQKLVRQFGAKTAKRSDIPKMKFALAVNATPLGMGTSQESPINERELRSVERVFDLVYNPAETRLIQLARAQGIPVISGVEMFVYQAARQFEIWTGKPAPLELMRNLMLRQSALRAPSAAQPKSDGEAADKAEAEKAPAPAKARSAQTTGKSPKHGKSRQLAGAAKPERPAPPRKPAVKSAAKARVKREKASSAGRK
jgi:3-dehydroquinate dehydratase/shikimate dehydrogenase